MTSQPTAASQYPCACGITAASRAPRCISCPQSRTSGLGEVGSLSDPARRTTDPNVVMPLMTYSRWKKTDGTFGPLGRVIATLLLLVPLPVLAFAIASGIGIIGAGLYVLVVMPWALRDIWKRGATHVEPPAPTTAMSRAHYSGR